MRRLDALGLVDRAAYPVVLAFVRGLSVCPQRQDDLDGFLETP
jgi:hypothetical protein